MDNYSIVDKRAADALAELKIINRYLGGISATSYALKKLYRYKTKETIRILDAGAGGSDVLLGLISKYNLNVFGADINLGICKILNTGGRVETVNADIFTPPFRGNSFDVVHASLLFHHFNREEIISLIGLFTQFASTAVIINDLQRSRLALIGIKLLVTLFSKSEMVKNDAPLSVKRAFKREELKEILKAAGIQKYRLKWKWAFRWILIIYIEK